MEVTFIAPDSYADTREYITDSLIELVTSFKTSIQSLDFTGWGITPRKDYFEIKNEMITVYVSSNDLQLTEEETLQIFEQSQQLINAQYNQQNDTYFNNNNNINDNQNNIDNNNDNNDRYYHRSRSHDSSKSR